MVIPVPTLNRDDLPDAVSGRSIQLPDLFGGTLSVPIRGDPGRGRTCDLKLRKLALYPTELRDQTLFILPQDCK